MIRLLCSALLLASAIGCGGEVRCLIHCGTGATVERNFSSCSQLRDDFNRRQSSGTISECEATALEACIQEQCANSPL